MSKNSNTNSALNYLLGRKNKYYFLCHEQKSSNDQRKLVLRSPIQIRNTLKVPLEIKFESSHIRNYSSETQFRKSEFGKEESHNFKLYLNPDSTSIVPIKMIDSEKLKNNVNFKTNFSIGFHISAETNHFRLKF